MAKDRGSSKTDSSMDLLMKVKRSSEQLRLELQRFPFRCSPMPSTPGNVDFAALQKMLQDKVAQVLARSPGCSTRLPSSMTQVQLDTAGTCSCTQGERTDKVDHTEPQTCLAVLPPDVLECIISRTDPHTRLALNRTCKGTQAVLLGRTIHFSGKEPRTTLTLDAAGDPTAASRALQTAARAAHNVTLHVQPFSSSKPSQISPGGSERAWLDTILQPWLTDTAAPSASSAAAAAAFKAPTPLQHVSTIILSKIHLDRPFPTCIGAALPNLQHYTLNKVQWPSTAAVSSVRWAHLTSLNITSSTPWQFTQALSPFNFPSLTHLRLCREATGDMSLSEQEGVVACCAAFSSQLTVLEMTGCWKHVDPGCIHTLFRTTCFPHLVTAHVAWELSDPEFCALITGSPALKDLHVESLKLRKQHVSEQCNLEKLTMDVWLWAHHGIASLARLPSTPHRLTVKLPSFVLLDSTIDPQQVAAVVANLRLCAHPKTVLVFQLHAADACAAHIQALLPMLQAACVQDVCLSGAHISSQLLTVLGTLGLTRVDFMSCSWDAGVSAHFWEMVPYLKHVTFFKTSAHDAADAMNLRVTDLMVTCCTATRPVTVWIEGLTKPNQESILHAVKSAGKDRLVKLMCI